MIPIIHQSSEGGIAVKEVIASINSFIWGIPLIGIVLFVGVFFTVGSGFFQFRYFGHIMKQTFGALLKKDDGTGKGVLNPFQAVSAAVGGAVGVGNIGGVATFINLVVILLLSGKFFQLLRDYKARYLKSGSVDPNFKVFYEDENPAGGGK
jgi:Na+/alanine symporter